MNASEGLIMVSLIMLALLLALASVDVGIDFEVCVEGENGANRQAAPWRLRLRVKIIAR